MIHRNFIVVASATNKLFNKCQSGKAHELQKRKGQTSEPRNNIEVFSLHETYLQQAVLKRFQLSWQPGGAAHESTQRGNMSLPSEFSRYAKLSICLWHPGRNFYNIGCSQQFIGTVLGVGRYLGDLGCDCPRHYLAFHPLALMFLLFKTGKRWNTLFW